MQWIDASTLRALGPIALGYHLLQQIGAVLVLWWWRPLPVEAPREIRA